MEELAQVDVFVSSRLNVGEFYLSSTLVPLVNDDSQSRRSKDNLLVPLVFSQEKLL